MRTSSPALLLPLLLAACAPAADGPLPDPAAYVVNPADVQVVPGVGDVGRWMVTKQLGHADWLGLKVGGRVLREPINVILVDRAARTPGEATTRLLAAMTTAGYGPKNGHSDGYLGLIGGRLYAQQPVKGRGLAFSNGPWDDTNDHGRMFGPATIPGGFVFTGAFSREDFQLLPRAEHTYNSFGAARADLAAKLSARTAFKLAALVPMDSRLDTPAETTGDHDGQAALLIAER